MVKFGVNAMLKMDESSAKNEPTLASGTKKDAGSRLLWHCTLYSYLYKSLARGWTLQTFILAHTVSNRLLPLALSPDSLFTTENEALPPHPLCISLTNQFFCQVS